LHLTKAKINVMLQEFKLIEPENLVQHKYFSFLL